MAEERGEPTAESLFAEYLAHLDEGQELSFENWLEDYSEQADALRLLHQDWAALGSLRDVVPGTGSFFFHSGDAERPIPAPGLTPGKVVGEFRLVELIGQGGMGQVWEAEQATLGNRRVAVKFVRPERVTERQLELFQREARAGGRLSHPGIVAVHGFGEDDGIAWIAMELVDGCWTLRDFLDETAREEEVPQGYDRYVAQFVAEIAEAMQAAHESGVIHRDLKPQNVLITRDDHPKVTDFGLARITDETALSQSGDVVGTYYYMSPEQVRARRSGIDHRTDVFSLGVILYEMLALQRPFQGDTTQQIATQIVSEEPPHLSMIRSRIPRDLSVIVGKALEKDPYRRYGTMRALAADLRRHLSNEPIEAQPPSVWERAVKWTKRNPTKSVAGALAGSAFTVISLLFAENVRTLGERDDAIESLESANEVLDAQATEMELMADNERQAAERERRRADEVLSLSAFQQLDDLRRRADELWPPHPENIQAYEEWMADAQKVAGRLEEFYEQLDRFEGIPRQMTGRELDAARRADPGYASLEKTRVRVAAWRMASAIRSGEQKFSPPSLASSSLPGDLRRRLADGQMRSSELLDLARPRLALDRTTFGQEAEGLALAQMAEERAENPTTKTACGQAVALGLYAVGLDDEAIAQALATANAAPEELIEQAENFLFDLKDAVAANAQDGHERLAAAEAEVKTLEVRIDRRVSRTFEDDRQRWWHGQLVQLLGEIEALVDDETGLRGHAPNASSTNHGWSVPRRLAMAERLRDGLTEGGDWDRRWQAAIAAIREHEAYGGLELTPQVGLVPIGTDPASGLWEFWHVATGTEPKRDARQRLVPTSDMGLVLVLIPSGIGWMGAQKGPDNNHYDPDAQSDEDPVHEVTLSAYFLSKYEMTQGQWGRATGVNPSRWTSLTKTNWRPGPHPVEQVSWVDCMRELPRMGLALPSEAQWEYGCRAKTNTPRPFAFEAFVRHANIADQAYDREFTHSGKAQAWDDGHGGHAVVGSFAANGFGLHDMLGNVWEWCLDGYDRLYYEHSPTMDPVAPFAGAAERVNRGGCFYDAAFNARSADRNNPTPSNADPTLGVRPARILTQ